MSSFICSDKQFAVVAKIVFGYPHQQQSFADMLKRHNIRSVNERYSERNRFRKVDLSVVSDKATLDYSPHDALRLLECIDYQSCDASDYDDTLISLARRFLQKMGADSNKAQPNLWSI